MNLILAAIPFFVLLILVELALDRYRHTRIYRLNDAFTSMSTGVLTRTMGFSSRFSGFLAYSLLWTLLPHGELAMTPALWVIAFVIYDFCCYWNCRAQHYINALRGIPVVHHPGDEPRLDVALRQPFNGFLTGAVFYLPMLFLGFPPVVVVTAGSLSLIYQYWVRPRRFRMFSDHDADSVSGIWARLFSTWKVEIPDASLKSGLLKDIWHYEKLKNRLHIWLMPAGLRQKFKPSLPRELSLAVLFVHFLLLVFTLWFLLWVPVEKFSQAVLHFIPLSAGVWLNGRILQGRPEAVLHSSLFWGMCALMPWWYQAWLLPPMLSSLMFLAAALVMPFAAGRHRLVLKKALQDEPDRSV